MLKSKIIQPKSPYTTYEDEPVQNLGKLHYIIELVNGYILKRNIIQLRGSRVLTPSQGIRNPNMEETSQVQKTVHPLLRELVYLQNILQLQEEIPPQQLPRQNSPREYFETLATTS